VSPSLAGQFEFLQVLVFIENLSCACIAPAISVLTSEVAPCKEKCAHIPLPCGHVSPGFKKE